MSFTPIKVSRAVSPHSKRSIPNVSIAQTKVGDLSIILSPDFFAAHPALFVGARIIVACDAETEQLALIPAESGMGGGHDKFLRAICVWLAGTVPLYWWKPFDTYKVGTVTQSESTMHTLMKKGVSSDMFEGGYPCFFLNCIRLTGSFERLNRWLPQSYLQKRIVQTNYAALANILAQREQHKLPEWGLFCTQIRTDVQHPELLA